ncbi:MAG TPA: ABC transporter ATP-binding protein [Candidatus Merdivicinus excrementipullorum]|uniref:ABC transporter ATP-binding protein n=1 Tax=Candidatus Merdivicinus excrementipullorum TaxID=2840867 RepID=A0A9D1FM96_9FIRM|nr:ABC transporter ATP-binding protein [Candidatus Merdivicinus excrementipullorum]
MTQSKKKEKPLYNLWQNTAWMMGSAWKTRKSVLFLCVAVAAGAVALSLTELFVTPAVLQKVETAAPFPELLGAVIGFALLLMLVSALNAYLGNITSLGRIEVRIALLQQVGLKYEMTSFPNTEDPAVLKKMEKANEAMYGNTTASEAVWTTLTDLLKNIAGFVIYLALLSSLDPVLLIVVLATTVVGFFVSQRINQWGYRHREEESAYLKKLNYITYKAPQRALGKDIRIFGLRPWLQDVFDSAMRLYSDFIARREKVYLWADVVDVLLSFARNGIAYVYLITMALGQGLPASQFLLYFTAIGGFTTWITGILAGFSTLNLQSMDLSTIREFLEIPELFLFEDGKPLKAENIPYEIELRNVRFRYPGAEQDTLHDLNLTIHAGEKLAVVGLNGAGKTTLVKLICGFYDPTEGQVLLNGQDIRQYNRRDYYKLFTAVFQDFSILETTLADNVTQSTENIDRDRMKDCIEKAGLTEKIDSLKAGMETHVGRSVYEDGMDLSGGETQRLMLARALYKGAPIMVLDEPTAALDPIAENDMYLKYNQMAAGCTSVYISHRLASTRFCDRIILLSDGGIAEEGTHDSLMAQGGKYTELFGIQSRYYGKEDLRKGSGSHEE